MPDVLDHVSPCPTGKAGLAAAAAVIVRRPVAGARRRIRVLARASGEAGLAAATAVLRRPVATARRGGGEVGALTLVFVIGWVNRNKVMLATTI